MARLEDLPPKMRAAVIKSLAKNEQQRIAKTPRSRKTASSDVLLRCCTDGCDFPPTSSETAMEKHCDSVGHHRYEIVLE